MSQSGFEFKADANDSSPLYMQIARKLSDDVHNGRYQVDQALPSERALSELLNVSRVTARKAIDQLVDQGLVVRRRGSGNYIAPRIEQPLSNLTSFSEQLQQRGYTPKSRWLKRAIVTAVPVLRHGFDLPAELEARRGRLWADCETMLRIQDFLAVHPDQKIQQAADTMARNLERQARELKVQLRM